MPEKGKRCGSDKMGVMTPVTPKKRTGRPAKEVMAASRVPKPKESCLGSREEGPDVMDVLLDRSSRFQAHDAYIASQQETDRFTPYGRHNTTVEC